VKFQTKVLSNGLEVVSEYRPSAVSSAIGFFVKTGARDEDSVIAGVSHFLEHMMFKGTAKRNALELTYEMGSLGAQANAFTSEENTVYYMGILPEYFENALELLSDMLRPSLEEKEFNVEKNVILEEIALYQDRPTYVLLEKALSTFFGKHPAGNSVLGSIESISALSRDQMKAYFDKRYTPSNIVLSASGNYSVDKYFELAEKYCGSWKDEKVVRQRPAFDVTNIKHELTKKDITRSHIMLLSKGPDVCHPLRYEADVLTTILGDSSGSKIFWDLVDTGLCDGASVESEQMDGVGVLYGYASTNPLDVEEVTERLGKVMSNPLDFTDEDLQRAVTKTATRIVFQAESNMRRMMSIGFDWLYNREYVSPDEDLKRIKAVSRDSIKKLVEEFNFVPTSTVIMRPE
jgi:predicted Zn-dependent peptidase